MSAPVLRPPDRLHTARLLLRRFRPDDAEALHPALAQSVAHLQPWIPWEVAEPAPVPQLAERLTRFDAAFDADERWLYGIFAIDDGALLGGIGLYPRAAEGRVPFARADHVEIGYWLRADATGRGYAREATEAIVAVARTLPHVTHVAIRVDPRNAPSVAIPARLGFVHARTEDGVGGRATMVWTLAADDAAR